MKKAKKYKVIKAQYGVAPKPEDFGDNYEAYIQALEDYITSLQANEEDPFSSKRKLDKPDAVSPFTSNFQKLQNEDINITRDLSKPSERLKEPKQIGTDFSRLKLAGTGGIDDLFNLGEGIGNIGNGDNGNPMGKALGIINPAARIATKIGNQLQDIDNTKDEYKQYLKALQPAGYDSNIEDGLNNKPIYTQYGGSSNIVEAEKGEVYTTTDGGMEKVPESGNTHEQGGELIFNAERVLEDTSDKRKDRVSKALKVNPKMANILADVTIGTSMSHSKIMEKAKEQNFKKVKAIEKKLEKNIKTLEKIPNNVYAKNSMDMNLMNLQQIPTDGEVFDELFDHQEFIKAALGVEIPKAQYGGKYGIVKAQNGYIDKGYGTNRRPKGNATMMPVYNPDDGLWYLKPRTGAAQPSTPPTPAAPIDGIKTGKDGVPRRPVGAPGFKPEEWTYNQTDGLWYRNAGATGSSDGIRTGKDGVIRRPVNAPGFKPEEWKYNTKDGLWYRTVGGTKRGTTGGTKGSGVSTPSTQDIKIQGFDKIPNLTDTTINTTSQPTSASTTDTTINTTSQPTSASTTDTTINTTSQPTSGFNEPLNWFDVAGPMAGLLEGRIPVKYNPAQLNQVRLQQQNPLPALQAGQTSYNAAINNLPNTGAGNANKANIFTSKYNIDNQILGQYENADTSIKNQEVLYNSGIRDKQSLLDQTAREVFESKYLGSKEAQRQQKLTSMDELYQRLALNKKLNREGNLLMKLFPNFDQNANYNGRRYTFRNPISQPK